MCEVKSEQREAFTICALRHALHLPLTAGVSTEVTGGRALGSQHGACELRARGAPSRDCLMGADPCRQNTGLVQAVSRTDYTVRYLVGCPPVRFSDAL